jgi:hypothetical protein
MLASIRRAIAVVLALLVTVLTLGRVEVRRTGKGGGAPGDGPERLAATQVMAAEEVELAGGARRTGQ